ncbi:hypothetical protein [Delftia deserti]|uniref:Uncharacterized protein n=1 Tax=Delftia deserti TaxID=1651218 RepID=A0ABW5EW50_9BURK
MTTAPTPSDVERLARGLEEGFCGHAAWLQPAAAELRRLQADNEAMRETLEFVERWAVHHASKPHMTAELALGSIQHHPEIRAITERYADGKRPETFDPYARIAELEARKPLPLSDAEIIAAQDALALSRSRIGLRCSRCETGKYRADCNAYHDFHRCDSCMHVPMWGEDGKEIGPPTCAGESS